MVIVSTHMLYVHICDEWMNPMNIYNITHYNMHTLLFYAIYSKCININIYLYIYIYVYI